MYLIPSEHLFAFAPCYHSHVVWIGPMKYTELPHKEYLSRAIFGSASAFSLIDYNGKNRMKRRKRNMLSTRTVIFVTIQTHTVWHRRLVWIKPSITFRSVLSEKWIEVLCFWTITITPEMMTLLCVFPPPDVTDTSPLHVAPDFGVEHCGEVELHVERRLCHLKVV